MRPFPPATAGPNHACDPPAPDPRLVATPRLRGRSAGALLFAVLLALAACDSGSTTEPVDATIDAVTGGGQTGEVGEALDSALVVRVRDLAGEPLSNREVRFSVIAGGGNVEASVVPTDADGRAATTWVLGTRAGQTQRVRAALEGAASSAGVEFDATAVAGPPNQLEKVSGDEQLGQRNARLPRDLTVRVTDRFGNPVPGQSVVFAALGGEGSLDPGASSTGSAGIATSAWVLGPPLGEQMATASVSGLDEVSFRATALESPYIGGVVGSVFMGETFADLRLGAPGFDPSAPVLEVTGAQAIIPGGGAVIDVAAEEDFSTLYVFVDGFDGYYEFDLGPIAPAEVGSSGEVRYELAAVLEPLLPDDEYEFAFATGKGAGAGPRTPSLLEVHRVDVGPLQVSVAWDVASDVDLILVEPNGETIYYDQQSSGSGGELQLDSNLGCVGEDLRNESITWPQRPPPTGSYEVRLGYWSSCELDRTRWLVVIRIHGEVSRTVEGIFTGPGGTAGTEALGEYVTTFSF